MRKGFSLIELLVVLLIIGILAAIAYPAYKDYITRARRADGQAALMDIANRMERYYSERNTYQNASLGAGNANDISSNTTSPEGWYRLSITNASQSTYTLVATPLNAQATSDTKCQTLTLNHLGTKGISGGPSGAPTSSAGDCW